jgi:protein TonB
LNSKRVMITAAALFAFAVSAVADVRISTTAAVNAAKLKPSPEYSPMARQMKVTGAVEVEIMIATDGSVEGVKVLSGNPLLTSTVVPAVKKWKFEPFTADGQPTKAITLLKFDFKP